LDQLPGISWRPQGGQPQRNPDRPYEPNLDTFAFPARHLANNALYRRPDTGAMQTTLVTNRGCPYGCIYCLASQVSGTRNRYRSVGNVLDEIRQCVQRHGIRSFLFRSDLFNQKREWVTELCRAILEEGLRIEWACNSRVDTLDAQTLGWMKRAGCWIIAVGVESGNQATLDRIGKKARAEQAYEAIRLIRAAGIKSSVYLLMGLPWDTAELIEEQIEFARRLDPDLLEIFYVYPFPGTPLYEICLAEGLLEPGQIPAEAYDAPAAPSLFLSRDELRRLRNRALRKFYLRPQVIWRTLAGARSPRELLGYIGAGLRQLRALLGD
jgi:radical SAM superfamily enzyme YgiQ (UPF0313 family)